MTKTEYAQYTQSEHWLQLRKKKIAEVFNKCECCHLPRWVAALVYDQDLHVHHLNYQNIGDEQLEDLEVLCRRCHEIETFGRSDFKKIKQAECSLCGVDHCDIYSDVCEKCRALFPAVDEELFLFNFTTKDRNGDVFWKILLADFINAAHCHWLRKTEVHNLTQIFPLMAAALVDEVEAQVVFDKLQLGPENSYFYNKSSGATVDG